MLVLKNKLSLLFDLQLTTPVRQSLFYLWSYSYARRDNKPRGEMSPVRGGQMRRMASSGASQISRALSVQIVLYSIVTLALQVLSI
jgi:hypothetical protein